MTQGLTRYADVTTLVPDIYEGALFQLRYDNLLVPTVRIFNDTVGMNPRKLTQYGAANPRQVAEGEDVVPTVFDKSLLATLTPYTYADQFLITDERVRTDGPDSVRTDGAEELGGAFAEDVDQNITGNFASLTGGTVAPSSGTLSILDFMLARSVLQTNKARGPFFAVVHPYQWYRMVALAGSATYSFNQSPAFQDRLVENYFVSPLLGDVIFVVTPNITVPSSGTAVGAMYARAAIGYDERKAFMIETQRDASRRATELNASMDYATGVLRATTGVQLKGLATNPS